GRGGGADAGDQLRERRPGCAAVGGVLPRSRPAVRAGRLRVPVAGRRAGGGPPAPGLGDAGRWRAADRGRPAAADRRLGPVDGLAALLPGAARPERSVPVKGTRAAPSARPLSGWDQNAGVGAAEQAPLSHPPAEQIALSTQPAEPRAPVGGGLLVAARHAWRRLTSMRTALVLLFLLALAAVPGSLLPQRRLNLAKVAQYRAEH